MTKYLCRRIISTFEIQNTFVTLFIKLQYHTYEGTVRRYLRTFISHERIEKNSPVPGQSRRYMRCVRCGGARPSRSGRHSRVA